jgi:hypothetical protein
MQARTLSDSSPSIRPPSGTSSYVFFARLIGAYKVLIVDPSYVQRIFTYSTWMDKALVGAAVVASICAGVTMPAMNIIFGKSTELLLLAPDLTDIGLGRMVGSFTGYYSYDAATTTEMFSQSISQCA